MKDDHSKKQLDPHLIKVAEELHDLINSIIDLGVKQKEIAKVISVQEGVLSKLKQVLERIRNNSLNNYHELEDYIKSLRCMRADVYRDFISFLEKLKSFKAAHIFQNDVRVIEKSNYKKWKDGQAAQLESTFKTLDEKKYDGLYDMYNLSSMDNNQISIQPMMIRKSELDNSIEVFTGNEQSEYSYEGFAMILGGTSLYLTMVDSYHKTEEVVNILFSLPLLRKPPFLKGCLLSIDRLRQLYSTRVVVVRKNGIVSTQEYQSIPSELIDQDKPRNELEVSIFNYLKDEIHTSLRFTSFTSPIYGLSELDKEKEWLLKRHMSFLR